jgi:hypothetical protein
MMPRLLRTSPLLSCLLWLAALPPMAAAEEGDDSVTAAARALAIDGVKLAQIDHCDQAVDKLERAEKLHHSPIVLANLGQCYIKLGRLVEGVERLRAVLREPLPAAPSDTLQQAYNDSKRLLDETRPKLANLTVSVEGSADAEPNVSIDGHALPSALIGAAHPSDPGQHSVRVSARGYQTNTRVVMLDPGESQTVLVSLQRDPSAAPISADAATQPSRASAANEAPAPALTPNRPRSQARSSGPNLWPAYVAWGVGGVGLGVGIGFGIAAISNKANLNDHCPDKSCPPEQRSLLDTARRNATISTVGYVAAAAGAVAGTLIYVLSSRSETSPPREASGHLQVTPTGFILTL